MPYRLALKAGVALWAASIGLPANAQTNDDEKDESSHTEIVVTGTGLRDAPATPAYGVQVLGREQLTATGSGRIEDALAAVAGFQQFRRSNSRSSNPSAQGATLRALGGNAASRTQVLLDGVPMADPFFGYIPFSAIVPDRLASARVTRGGGSGPFGAGALAGTIELTSAGPATLGPASGQALANDRSETEASLWVAPRLGSGFATLSGRWDRGEGFFTTPLSERVPATARAAYESWSVQLRTVAPISETIEAQARLLAYRDARTLRFRGADTSMEGHDASLRVIGRGSWQFDLIGYVQARNFTNIVVSSTTFRPSLDQRNTPATGLGGKFELRPPTGGSNLLRIGIDYRRASGELFENAIGPATGLVTQRRSAGGTNSDLGLFVENDLTLGPIVLTAGARVDRTTIRSGRFVARDPAGAIVSTVTYPERGNWETSFRGGALADLGGGVRLRVAGYTGLRLPTLNELYRPFTVFPVVTQANAALRNERLAGFEAGIDLAAASIIDFSLTAFDNRVNGAIANVTVGPNLRQRQNIDAIRSRGIEANGRLALGRLSLAGSLAWTAAEANGSGAAAPLNGKRPAQTPRWAGSATLSWRPSEYWLVSTSLRHIGAQFEDDLETDLLPAATTLDAFVQMPLSSLFALVLRAENLTDTRIVTRDQSGSVDLGTPRTMWTGIKLAL